MANAVIFASIASSKPKSCASIRAPPRQPLLPLVSAAERVLLAGKAVVRVAGARDSDLTSERITVATQRARGVCWRRSRSRGRRRRDDDGGRAGRKRCGGGRGGLVR